ncbi:MAG TPA: transcription elongation factor GreB [Rhodanobacteraceae bacterium]|nr:transcription elongation factor GreB [Rhodanobacteraceae bacterium]
MTRWRPAAPPSTAIITRAGFERLKRELDELWNTRRPEIVQALSAAAAEGDRSENAEYIYRKKQLAELDRRVRYLSRRIPTLKVLDAAPARRDVVFFGATVALRRLSGPDEPADAAGGGTERHTVVGPDEIEPASGRISIDSPLARALLGHRAGDEVEVERPGGRARYAIEAVEYA